MKKLLLFVGLLTISFLGHAQITLASWTFPTGTVTDSLPDAGIAVNNNLGFRAVGASAINFSTNGLTTFCAQATNWDNGMDSKYWSIRFNAMGYGNLTLSCIIRSGGNNPGPRDFKVQYRVLPEINWTDAGITLVAANNWTSGVLSNVTLPAALDNQNGIIELRWVMTSNANANGGTVAATGISKIDNVMVKGSVFTGNLSGIVKYSNAGNTPMKQVTVNLYNGNVLAATAVTDTTGHYSFTNLAPGNYQVHCFSTQPWGGANSVDGLLILKNFVGSISLSGLFLQAADVNNSGFVNSSDALDILKRFAGMTTSFPIPDWIFESATVNVLGGSSSTQDIMGICAGDVNGSYIPN